MNYKSELRVFTQSLDQSLSWEERDKLITDKSRELKKKYEKKPKKRKKSRKQKLDARRQAYIKSLKEKDPDISEEEIQKALEKYSALENMLLDMDMTYNKRISQLRAELCKKYDISDPEILKTLRTEFIKEEIKAKQEFFKGKSESSEASKVAKERIKEMSTSTNPEHTLQFANTISADISKPNQPTSSTILETKPVEQLIESYKKEMEKKYENIAVIKKMVKNLINIELRNRAPAIRSEIELDYKLKEERMELENKWKTRKRYKNNNDLLQQNLDRHIANRRRTLKDSFSSANDPDESDKKAKSAAETIWRAVNRESKANPRKWNSMTQKEKLEPFTKGIYKDFYEAYPMIVKYMVYQLQYHPNALQRFLNKCRTNAPNPNPTLRKKGEVMEYWLENQAWYCRYLYEEYRKAKNLPIDMEKAKRVYSESYRSLRKERSDFESKFEKTKGKIDEELAWNIKTKIGDIIQDLKENKLSGQAKNEAINLLQRMIAVQDECD